MTRYRMTKLKIGDSILDIQTSKICLIVEIKKDCSIVIKHPSGYFHRFNLDEHTKISEVF